MLKLYHRRFDRSLGEAIKLLEEGRVEEATSKLKDTLESYRRHSQFYSKGDRFERDVFNRFKRGGVVFKSEHSFGGVDILVFNKAPRIKLLECKVSRKDRYYVMPEDYAKLHDKYHQLKRRGFDPEPYIVVSFPHRRKRRLIKLRDEWMDSQATLRVEYSAKSRRTFVYIAKSRRKKYERRAKFERLQAERLRLLQGLGVEAVEEGEEASGFKEEGLE